MPKTPPPSEPEQQSGQATLERLLEAAGLPRGFRPFGYILQREGFDLPDGAASDMKNLVFRRALVALGHLNKAQCELAVAAYWGGVQEFEDVANVLRCLAAALASGPADLKPFSTAAKDLSKRSLGERWLVLGAPQHQRLQVLAQDLEGLLAKGASRIEVYREALARLPGFAPALCPMRTRMKALRQAAQDSLPAAVRKLSSIDGEALVRAAARAYGMPSDRARHLFDAEDARVARSAKKPT